MLGSDWVVEVRHADSGFCVFTFHFVEAAHLLGLNYWTDLLRSFILLLAHLTFSILAQWELAEMVRIPLEQTIYSAQLGLTAFPPTPHFCLSPLVLAETLEFALWVVFKLVECELWMFWMMGSMYLVGTVVWYFCGWVLSVGTVWWSIFSGAVRGRISSWWVTPCRLERCPAFNLYSQLYNKLTTQIYQHHSTADYLHIMCIN